MQTPTQMLAGMATAGLIAGPHRPYALVAGAVAGVLPDVIDWWARQVFRRPDVVITLNPDEVWAHPQHVGLARIVQAMYEQGRFDTPGRPRPLLYGIREHGWYARSLLPQSGDVTFDRTARSPVLGRTYAGFWARATSYYVSQSSHPLWFAARAGAGILPGYGAVDLLRRLGADAQRPGLEALFDSYAPDKAAMRRLPLAPRVVDLSGS